MPINPQPLFNFCFPCWTECLQLLPWPSPKHTSHVLPLPDNYQMFSSSPHESAGWMGAVCLAKPAAAQEGSSPASWLALCWISAPSPPISSTTSSQLIFLYCSLPVLLQTGTVFQSGNSHGGKRNSMGKYEQPEEGRCPKQTYRCTNNCYKMCSCAKITF